MPTTVSLKNLMLSAIDIDRVQLHSDNPGSDGSQNQVGPLKTCTFGAPNNGQRALAADVVWTENELPPNQIVTYVSFWKAATPNQLRAIGQIQGDTRANSRGEYKLTTDTKFILTDA
jgi:hypothetical protein